MSYKRVLIPYDGSAANDKLVDFLCRIQSTMDFELHIVYVKEVPRNLPMDSDVDARTLQARGVLKKAEFIAETRNVPVTTSVTFSRSFEDAVLTVAEELGCDLIVLYQKSGRLKLFADSVQNIYQRAKCEVWMIRNVISEM